jgi:eukaryotic-like serine/threonine-protein kinase
MEPERWHAIEELYHSASDLPDGPRQIFLRDACEGDEALFDEVESLLQAAGQPVDQRSDIFSLGAVLYEITTQRLPFAGKSSADVIREIQRAVQPPISALNPQAPSGLCKIIDKALQEQPRLRYQNATEMQLDLEVLLKRLARKTRERRASLTLALLLVLVAVGATVSLRVSSVREWILGKSSANAARQTKSLAVLPFKNLTGDSSQEYFVDGMTEALIANLTKLASVRVISSTSTMHYKGNNKALPEIAHELNVATVLEGSVLRSGNRVRVSAQLVDSTTDQNLWAQEYERDIRDVLQLQHELASAVAQEVSDKLAAQEQVRLAPGRKVKPEVYDAYLKGRYFSNRPMEDGLSRLAQ